VPDPRSAPAPRLGCTLRQRPRARGLRAGDGLGHTQLRAGRRRQEQRGDPGLCGETRRI